MNPSTRIVFNTGVLYFKLLVGMAIGLFTTRLVLNALGETNYGIYALVAGVVGMLGTLQSSMSIASMRYMSHSLGSLEGELINKTFNTTLFLHFVFGLILVVLMEAGGLLMFEYLLNIPEDRLLDAKIVFHFMVITTFVTIISVPYDSVINAHENILALSIVDLIGAVIRLGIAVYLTYSKYNLLIMYGALMFITQLLLRIIKQWYSRARYKECKINFRKYIDKKLAKSILSFTGWNLFGSLASMSVTQVRGILLNMFFGVALNAADGISRKASEQVNVVSISMTRALNPQLVKSEGGGNRQRMIRLTEISTKYSVFLFSLLAIPVIIEAPYLLNVWLDTVPEYAIIFSQMLLISLLLSKLTFEITSALRAVGKIKGFQVTESVILVLSVPVSYFVFRAGYPPYSIFIVNYFSAILLFFTRLYFGKKVAGINIKGFLRQGIIPVIAPLILSVITALTIHFIFPESLSRFLFITIASIIVMIATFWHFGLGRSEKSKLKVIVYSLLSK